MFVIINDEGQLYGGYNGEIGRPIWFKTKREGCELEEAVADACIKQLKQLGYEKIVKRPAGGIIRKWVPADLDASADLPKETSA